ncbi:MAG: BON domain-containing protein [Pseudomonadota bacterium]
MNQFIATRPAAIIVGAILTFTIIACTNYDTAPKATIGNKIDDTVITAQVKAALMADQDIKGLGISVETRKGKVQLRGFADNQPLIDQSVRLAQAVTGVQDVDNGIALRSSRQSLGGKVDDSILTVRVQSALMADNASDSADIKVASNAGIVQLSGFVASQAKIDQAVRVAGAVEGARSVRNEMGVKH